MEELSEQMQSSQRVAWADNAIKLAVEMTVASIGQIDLTGSPDEQAMQVRDAIRVLFPEAVTLVREAREGKCLSPSSEQFEAQRHRRAAADRRPTQLDRQRDDQGWDRQRDADQGIDPTLPRPLGGSRSPHPRAPKAALWPKVRLLRRVCQAIASPRAGAQRRRLTIWSR